MDDEGDGDPGLEVEGKARVLRPRKEPETAPRADEKASGNRPESDTPDEPNHMWVEPSADSDSKYEADSDDELGDGDMSGEFGFFEYDQEAFDG
eukprot:g2472.t1